LRWTPLFGQNSAVS